MRRGVGRRFLAETVACTNAASDGGGCPELLSPEQLEAHLEVCRFRVVACENRGCRDKILVTQLAMHMAKCGYAATLCLRGCGQAMSLQDAMAHRAECPQEPVPCPHKQTLACPFECARIVMPRHAADFAIHAPLVSALVNECTRLKQANFKLETEVYEAARAMDELQTIHYRLQEDFDLQQQNLESVEEKLQLMIDAEESRKAAEARAQAEAEEKLAAAARAKQEEEEKRHRLEIQAKKQEADRQAQEAMREAARLAGARELNRVLGRCLNFGCAREVTVEMSRAPNGCRHHTKETEFQGIFYHWPCCQRWSKDAPGCVTGRHVLAAAPPRRDVRFADILRRP